MSSGTPGPPRAPKTAANNITYEKMNQPAKAREFYQKAYEMATAHNPPAVHTRPVARKKLGIAAPEPK